MKVRQLCFHMVPAALYNEDNMFLLMYRGHVQGIGILEHPPKSRVFNQGKRVVIYSHYLGNGAECLT